MSGAQHSADSGSTIRLIGGSTLCILSIAGALFGFISLIQVLDAGGYGTPAMRNELVVLGVAGAGLAAGIAIVIWDIAMRYEKK